MENKNNIRSVYNRLEIEFLSFLDKVLLPPCGPTVAFPNTGPRALPYETPT